MKARLTLNNGVASLEYIEQPHRGISIAKQVQMLRQIRDYYGNEVNCDSIISTLIDGKFRCPKCNGNGYVLEEYDAYPSNLPDSGFATDIRTREVKCDLCEGEGYTDKEYKPKMVQCGWEPK